MAKTPKKPSLVIIIPSHSCNNSMSEYHVEGWWDQLWQKSIKLNHITFTHWVVRWVTWHNCYKRYFFRKMGMLKSTFHVFSYNLNTRFLMNILMLQITKHRLATQFQMEWIYLKWLDNVCGKQYDTFSFQKQICL